MSTPPRAGRLQVVVLVIGTLATLAAFALGNAVATARRGFALDGLARDARTKLEQRVASYSESLYALRSLHEGRTEISPEDFHRFIRVADVQRRYPGLQVFSFNRAVPRPSVADYQADMRKAGVYPSFIVQPPAMTPIAYVVEDVEPLAGNEAVIGLDISTSPLRVDAIEDARDTGALTATAPIRLAQSSNLGLLLVLPVYDTAEIPVTPPARRRHFLGTMVAAVDVAHLIEGALGEQSSVHVVAVDDVGSIVGPASAAQPIYRKARGEARTTLDMNVASRRWHITFALPSSRTAPLTESLPRWVFAFVVAVISAAVWSLSRSRSRAVGLADAMTIDVREANAKLRAANETMRDFVAIASHDMRTPLSALTGFSQILDEKWDQLSAQDRKTYISIVRRHATRLVDLVDDLLVTSEIDARAVSVHPGEVNVAAAVAEAAAIAAVTVDTSGLNAFVVHADERHVQRMLTNYLTNADKYGAPPITVEATASDGHIDIHVRDAGPGVDPQFVDRLFEKFTRADASGRPDAPRGTGLGLAIVRGLAEANGGRAWYDRDRGFVIRLPAVG